MRERLELSLPVRVFGRESEDTDWVETTRLIDVTPFGARFALARPTEPGRLLHLTLPMPRQLRCFDHVEDQYRVWALVRNIKVLEAAEGKPARFEIGVAFIGKRAARELRARPDDALRSRASVTESGPVDGRRAGAVRERTCRRTSRAPRRATTSRLKSSSRRSTRRAGLGTARRP